MAVGGGRSAAAARSSNTHLNSSARRSTQCSMHRGGSRWWRRHSQWGSTGAQADAAAGIGARCGWCVHRPVKGVSARDVLVCPAAMHIVFQHVPDAVHHQPCVRGITTKATPELTILQHRRRAAAAVAGQPRSRLQPFTRCASPSAHHSRVLCDERGEEQQDKHDAPRPSCGPPDTAGSGTPCSCL